jgi:deazaflavin-dependent oxidoreductase (nitroreductase family)
MSEDEPDWSGEDFCYLTTVGRTSGNPHTIEIWFGARGSTIYLMAGNRRSDWVRNILGNPRVDVRVGEHQWQGRGRVVTDPEEEGMVRRLLASKYQRWREGRPLSGWATTALPVAIDLS